MSGMAPSGEDRRPIESAAADAESLSSNAPAGASDDHAAAGCEAANSQGAGMHPWTIALIVIAIGSVLTLLYLVNPAERRYGPPCIFHTTTGLHCPGCGGTRAAHALLHGDVRQAAAWNVLALVVVPVLAGYGIYYLVALIRHRRAPVPQIPRVAIIVIVAVFVLFMILRNLPFEPFTSLAPHSLPRATTPENPEE